LQLDFLSVQQKLPENCQAVKGRMLISNRGNMLRPIQETHEAGKLTTNSLSPEESRFRDWLIDGSPHLSDNAYRDESKSAPKPRPTIADAAEPRVSAGPDNTIVFN
jgi:hypothetical protein